MQSTHCKLWAKEDEACCWHLSVACRNEMGLLFKLGELTTSFGVDVVGGSVDEAPGGLFVNELELRGARAQEDEAKLLQCCRDIGLMLAVEGAVVEKQGPSLESSQFVEERFCLCPDLVAITAWREVEEEEEGGGLQRRRCFEMEVQGVNQAGLVAFVAHALHRSGFVILGARISNRVEGSLAKDLFKVTAGRPDEAKRRLRAFFELPPSSNSERQKETEADSALPFQLTEEEFQEHCQSRRTIHGKDGTSYAGHWKEGRREGLGFYVREPLQGDRPNPAAMPCYRYEGRWRKDWQDGFGVEETENSTFYGAFRQGRRIGWGVSIPTRCRNLARIAVLTGEGRKAVSLQEALEAHKTKLADALQKAIEKRQAEGVHVEEETEEEEDCAQSEMGVLQSSREAFCRRSSSTSILTATSSGSTALPSEMSKTGSLLAFGPANSRTSSRSLLSSSLALNLRGLSGSGSGSGSGLFFSEELEESAANSVPVPGQPQQQQEEQEEQEEEEEEEEAEEEDQIAEASSDSHSAEKQGGDIEAGGSDGSTNVSISPKGEEKEGASKAAMAAQAEEVEEVEEVALDMAEEVAVCVVEGEEKKKEAVCESQGQSQGQAQNQKTNTNTEVLAAKSALLWDQEDIAAFFSCLGISEEVCLQMKRGGSKKQLTSIHDLLEASDASLAEQLLLAAPDERVVVRRALQRLLDLERGAEHVHGHRKAADLRLDSVLAPFDVPCQDVEKLDCFGGGGFGKVHLGIVRGKEREPGAAVSERVAAPGEVQVVAMKEMCGSSRFANLWESLKEASVLAATGHPNVVAFAGVISDGPGSTQFILTKKMDCSLYALLHQQKPPHMRVNVDRQVALDLGEQIGKGLAHLHDRRLLHGDLKSANILIRDDSSWLPWGSNRATACICDFGHAALRPFASPHQRICTPHWAAPEVLRGDAVDCKADVYSYGVILWELLTKKLPFGQSNFCQVITFVGYGGQQLDVAKLPVELPQTRRLVKSCFEALPAKRPTAAMVVKGLKENRKRAKLKALAAATSFFRCG